MLVKTGWVHLKKVNELNATTLIDQYLELMEGPENTFKNNCQKEKEDTYH